MEREIDDSPGYSSPFNPYLPPAEPAPPGYQWIWDDGQGGWVIVPNAPMPETLPAPTIDPPGGVDPTFQQLYGNPVVESGGGDDGGNPYVPGGMRGTFGGYVPGGTTGGTGGGGTGGAPGGTFFTPFLPPEYTAPPGFTAPPAFSFPEFSYEAFRAPTLDEAQNDPGYKFGFDEGMRALQTDRAARGVLRTGGTLKDFMKWGNDYATQNYDNVFNRNLQTHRSNFGEAFDTWLNNRENAAQNYSLNYGIGRDVWDRNTDLHNTAWDRNYGRAQDIFNSLRQSETHTFEDLYRRWRDLLNTQTQLATMPVD
jgi:hypothetical protein